MKRAVLYAAISMAAMSYAAPIWNYQNAIPSGQEVWKQRRAAKRYKHKRKG